jgi:hypothetical protein
VELHALSDSYPSGVARWLDSVPRSDSPRESTDEPIALPNIGTPGSAVLFCETCACALPATQIASSAANLDAFGTKTAER